MGYAFQMVVWRVLALACLLTWLTGCTSTCETFGTYHIGAILAVDAGYFHSCEADLSSGGRVARYTFGGPCDATGKVQPIGGSPVPSVSEASGCQVELEFEKTDRLPAYLGSDSGTFTVTCDGQLVFQQQFSQDEAC